MVTRLMGVLVGDLAYLLATKPSKVTLINLRLCYPDLSEQERKKRCRRHMRQLAQLLFETPVVWSRPGDWLDKKVVAIHGLELFQSAVSSGDGLLLLAPHHGNWEVVGLWAAAHSKITSLYEPPKMVEFDAWVKSSREQSGATLVPTNVRGVAALIKALKRGEVSGILPDQQPPAESGEFAPFFGIQARTMTLIHNLIRKSACHALFSSAVRVPGGWELHFLPAETDIYSENEFTSLAALNRGVEQVVDLAPDQYQWEYKRFRARPQGDPKIYPPGS